MLDESSLASTNQVRDFLLRLGPEDRVVLIGDMRQHQAVEAGKPFEELQKAGSVLADRSACSKMRTRASKNPSS